MIYAAGRNNVENQVLMNFMESEGINEDNPGSIMFSCIMYGTRRNNAKLLFYKILMNDSWKPKA